MAVVGGGHEFMTFVGAVVGLMNSVRAQMANYLMPNSPTLLLQMQALDN